MSRLTDSKEQQTDEGGMSESVSELVYSILSHDAQFTSRASGLTFFKKKANHKSQSTTSFIFLEKPET